ncbi:hypothetical protein COJ27_26075 [Bacillus cereus]|uniref:hypothetical protein n=1 Tax=Bacillus cereus TaxID=1396 RepID=UPI000BF5DAD6|nr:hypothetical protein [Bacillus cereus]PFL58916.1 hypothetical protein COJ27_26075 [Bacillus cereus]
MFQRVKNTYLIVAFFSVVFGSLILFGDIHSRIISGAMYLFGLIYTVFLPVLKENFKEKVTSKRSIYLNNAVMDLVLWIVSLVGLTKLIDSDAFNGSEVFMYLYVVILLILKYALTTYFDLEKYNKESKG